MDKYEPDAMVLELDKEGGIRRWLYDRKTTVISDVTGAWQVGNSLYLTSKTYPFIGFLEMAQ